MVYALNRAVNGALAAVKWPVAIVAIALLPTTAAASWALVVRCAAAPAPLVPFLGGFVAYLATWWWILRRPGWGSLVPTFEHELTHAVFAWLTLHWVTGLRATWRKGGHVEYRGKGNWLITIGPYWFPTASAAICLALLWVPPEHLVWTNALLGATVSYHVTSTYLETHRGQPDLKNAGWVFSGLFLPAANVFAYGAVLAFAFGGSAEVEAYAGDIARRGVALFEVAAAPHLGL